MINAKWRGGFMCTPCASCFDQVVVPSWQASLIATGVALATTVALCALAAYSIHTIAGVSLFSGLASRGEAFFGFRVFGSTP